MTFTAPTIRFFFDLASQGGDFLTLDDPTKGELGSATYVLAGDVGVIVTSSAVAITIDRGRHDPLDEMRTGVATIQFLNVERTFDPFNTAGDYYGNLVPGKKVTIEVDGVSLLVGRVEDWEQDYTVEGDAIATCTVVDGLGALALAQFDAWTSTGGQLTGARITSILNRSEVGYPGGARDIDTGVSTLQADSVTWGSNVANYARLVAKSDLGYLFDSRSGVLTFRDRHANLNEVESQVFTDDFTTHPAGVPFHAITTSSTADMLYTSVSVDREGSDAQTSTDAVAVSCCWIPMRRRPTWPTISSGSTRSRTRGWRRSPSRCTLCRRCNRCRSPRWTSRH
jgi:hypothetical protein